MLLPFLFACVVGAPAGCPADSFCTADFGEERKACPAEGRCEKLPESREVALSLPIPAGERIYCAKGPLRAGADSHNACNASTRFAVDLASPAGEPPHLVLAPADGVAFPFGGCPSRDLNHQPGFDGCNFGFGNVVRIQHAPGAYAQVAHLSAILVSAGQKVVAGDPVGIEGNSGAAGPKHVHLSLHTGDAVNPRPGPTVPIRSLRVKGGVRSFRDLACGDWTASNVPRPETALVSETPARRGPERFGFTATLTPPRSPQEQRYWHAADLQAAKDLDAAKRELETLVAEAEPPWLAGWSILRLAEIAAAQGRSAEAHERATKAKALLPEDTALQQRAQKILDGP